MHTMKRHGLVVAAFALVTVITGNEAVACSFSRQVSIDLTGDGVEEKLLASVEGAACSDAIFSIQIVDMNGGEKYAFNHPFRDMYLSDPAVTPMQEAKMLVEEVIEEGVQKKMPPVTELVEPKEAPGITDVRHIPKDYYLKLQSAGLPYLEHRSWYEGYVYIVYDKNKDKFIVFGGM